MAELGIACWCLPGSTSQAIFEAGRLGFRLAQVDLGSPGEVGFLGSPETLRAVGDARSESAVRIVGLGVKAVNDIGLTAEPGSLEERRCRECIEAALTVAVGLDVRFVFFPSFRRSRMHGTEDIRRTAVLLKWACQLAAKAGILVGSENTLGVEGNLRLADTIGEPNHRVLLDTYNPVLFGHSTPALIKGLASLLSQQAHLKDGRGGKMGSATLGLGDARLVDCLRFIRQHTSIDTFILENNYRADSARRVTEDRDALRRMMEELAAQPTAASEVLHS